MSDIAFSVIINNDGIDDIIFKTIMLKGDKGNSIASIEKTSTAGLVDTYTITLTDGTIGGTFEVTNGSSVSIDDDDVSSSKTWSSSKLSEMIGEGIDDEDVSPEKLWSSDKIWLELFNLPLPKANTQENVVVSLFPDGADNVPVSDLIVDINAVQDGTGDASPTNVRAIHGWDTLNLVKCGTNIWDEEWESGTYSTADGRASISENAIRSKNRIAIKPSLTFAFFNSTANAQIRIYYYDKSGTFLSWEAKNAVNNVATFTTPENAYFVNFAVGNSSTPVTTNNQNLSINYPSADEDYHAYDGGVDTIDLTQEVYGGTLDVTTGTLEINKAKCIIDGTQNITIATQPYIKSDACDGFITVNDIYPRLSPQIQPNGFAICDKLSPAKQAIWNMTGYVNRMTINQNQIHLNIANELLGITDYTQETIATAKAKMKSFLENNPISVVFYIMPQVIQLTPTQVRTLLRQNQIYADTGNINKIVYFKTGSETIARMIEAYLRGE